MKIQEIRREIACVFDEAHTTKRWHKVANAVILGIIILSTLAVFISTFNVNNTLQIILQVIDIITLVFFTGEVVLRIWVADVFKPQYKGFIGRIKYCLTFYGIIDILSTMPFYLQWILPIPFPMFKVLRVLRVIRMLRIARYAKSFYLLAKAIRQKKNELIISLQFLIIITFVLSLMLYFCEHDVQPQQYDNGVTPFLWAFAQYIGDPGHFATNPPQTFWGEVIACIVGLLGIAIVAVPAGILGSGFIEALESEEIQTTLNTNKDKLYKSFEKRYDKEAMMYYIPPFITIIDLQIQCRLKMDEIIDCIKTDISFRLVNLTTTLPNSDYTRSCLAVQYIQWNCSYGCHINRNSRVTISVPRAYEQIGIANWGYHLAEMGDFNFISKEENTRQDFEKDINILTNNNNQFVITLYGTTETTQDIDFSILKHNNHIILQLNYQTILLSENRLSIAKQFVMQISTFTTITS